MSLSSLVRALLLLCCVPFPRPSRLLAQQWTGPYIAGHVGFSRIPEGSDNIIVFDRNLDGVFDDTIVTAAGANAFSPGFCAGAAATPLPSGGCAVDDDGIDVGGRAGYDWQMGRLVFGLVGDVAFPDHIDSVSAFSTTPAFYTLTRELDWLGGRAGRASVAAASGCCCTGPEASRGEASSHSFATSNTANTFVESEEEMAWGYQLGGGVEFRFGGRWTAGGEYLWTSLADEDRYTVRAQGPAPATNPFILGNASGSDLRRADSLNSARSASSWGIGSDTRAGRCRPARFADNVRTMTLAFTRRSALALAIAALTTVAAAGAAGRTLARARSRRSTASTPGERYALPRFGPARWLGDGTAYTTVERAPARPAARTSSATTPRPARAAS